MTRTHWLRVLDIVRCASFWACVGLVAYWALDRQPPFSYVRPDVQVVQRGTALVVTAQVTRDVSRGCSVKINRYIHDSRGFRWDVDPGPITVSAKDLEILERQSPGVVRLGTRLPVDMEPGKARFIVSLDYACNPLHILFPISALMEIDLSVLP